MTEFSVHETKIIVQKLFEYMKDSHVSQESMARNIGVSKSVFNKWFTKGAIPKTNSVFKIQKYLEDVCY